MTRSTRTDIWPPPPTETGRLFLKLLDPGDIDFVYRLYSDWEVSRHLLQVPFPFTRNDAEELVANAMSNCEAGGAVTMITRTDDHADVGLIVLRKLPDMAILGFSIVPEQWNKGYATEAARTMVEFAFNELEFATIQASSVEDNVASIRVIGKIEKIGFELHERDVLEKSLHSGDRLVRRYRLHR